MATLRKQSEAAFNLRDQLKRSLAVTGSDLANALSQIGRTAGLGTQDEWRGGIPALEGNTPTEADEPSTDPNLIPDRWKAIEDGEYDDEDDNQERWEHEMGEDK